MRPRMIWTTFLFQVALLAAPAQAARAEAAHDLLVQMDIFQVQGYMSGETSLDESLWAGAQPPDAGLKQALTLFTHGRFQFGQDKIEAAGQGWKFNDKPLEEPGPAANQTQMHLPTQLRVLCRPRITVVLGAESSMAIGSVQKVQYFERESGDRFRLRESEAPTGLRIVVKTEPTSDTRVRFKALDFSLKAVERREPIPGVALQVGRPVMQDLCYHTDLALTPGKHYGLLLNTGDSGRGILLMHLKVDLLPSAKPVSDATTTTQTQTVK